MKLKENNNINIINKIQGIWKAKQKRLKLNKKFF